MAESKNSLPFVFDSAELVAGCHLLSVLCPLFLPGIWAATLWDRPIKINKIQIGFIDIWNYGAYLNGDYT